MILKKRDKGNWDGIEKAAMMGTNFVAHTVVGLAIGYYFDKWLHTEPWGLIVWLLLGIVAGFRNMYQEAMKIDKAQSLGSGSRPGTGADGAADEAGPSGKDGPDGAGGKKDA